MTEIMYFVCIGIASKIYLIFISVISTEISSWHAVHEVRANKDKIKGTSDKMFHKFLLCLGHTLRSLLALCHF